jgi:cell wall-associated NlpC family hydrolase
MPAKAADANIGVSASSETGSQAAQLAVTAAPTATVSFERPAVTTVAAPVAETIAPQSSDEGQTADAGQAGNEIAGAALAVTAKSTDGAASAAASGLAAIAYTGIGSPYVWGGTTPSGWDCSGFTQWVYAQAGISIPRVNAWNAMKPTSTPAPGDLVMQNGGAHVGIYVGNGMMISALNPSDRERSCTRCPPRARPPSLPFAKNPIRGGPAYPQDAGASITHGLLPRVRGTRKREI